MKINKWNEITYNNFINHLISLKDSKTKDFNKKIINTNYEILGIKTPLLKEIAKELSKDDIEGFLKIAKDKYYEEVLIEGFLISYIKDIDTFIKYFNIYINKIDCWALCDSAISSYKIFKKNDFTELCLELILDSREYIERVGYVMLLDYYVDEEHIDTILNISRKESSYYYVNMAISWLLSECFIKQRDKTLALLKEKSLNKFVQNKAISKICDSYRVTKKDKEMIKKLRIE